MTSPPGPVSARDWYSVLSLSPHAPETDIVAAVERMTRQASALAATSPDRSRQLRELARSIKQDLLSGPDARRRYDESRAAAAAMSVPAPLLPSANPARLPPAPPVPQAPYATPAQYPTQIPQAQYPPQVPYAAQAPQPAGGQAVPARRSRIGKFLQSGWVCPACGNGAMPADKFCMKCGVRIPRPGENKPNPTMGDQSDHSIQLLPAAPAPRQVPVTCTACGTNLTAGQGFCTRCGTKRP